MRDLRLYFMGKESASDARFRIENRFRIFARLYGFKPDEPEHGANPARSLFVQSVSCSEQAPRPPAAFQSRIGKGAKPNRSPALFHVKHKPSEKNFMFNPDGFCLYGSVCMRV